MQSVSAAFLLVLALATQSFAAPAAMPDSYSAASSLVDTYLTQTYDDGQYHAFTSLPTSVPTSVTIPTSIPTLNPPMVTYGGPSSYGGTNTTDTCTDSTGTGYATGKYTGTGSIIKPTILKIIGTGVPTNATRTGHPKSSSVPTGYGHPTSSAPAPTSTATNTLLHGDGSTWPTIDKWVTFDALWSLNSHNIEQSCTGLKNATTGFTPPLNTPQETSDLKAAILSESKSASVDSRYILATVLQESHGCVHVGSTWANDYSVFNPGVMQDHNGPNSCYEAAAGKCTQGTIQGMIHDGVAGTWAYLGGGDGLFGTMKNATTLGAKEGTAQQVYWAAKIYNSGSYKAGDDLSYSPGATSTYASDIANRLIGAVF
ncbi:hypothetical protein LSUE1_G005747 [Lachnellula suecica]|uniref:Uncharacterized protein n=1 Tax=Lachnellula suecica TaxID=602035 RepID=A0A8T9C0X0_9HELO|nr:hypothetical protein LSUE1_G005747 [Lachnellula suecica]